MDTRPENLSVHGMRPYCTEGSPAHKVNIVSSHMKAMN